LKNKGIKRREIGLLKALMELSNNKGLKKKIENYPMPGRNYKLMLSVDFWCIFAKNRKMIWD